MHKKFNVTDKFTFLPKDTKKMPIKHTRNKKETVPTTNSSVISIQLSSMA